MQIRFKFLPLEVKSPWETLLIANFATSFSRSQKTFKKCGRSQKIKQGAKEKCTLHYYAQVEPKSKNTCVELTHRTE